jgi:sugar phosphate isomerase/epimerase
MHYTRRQFGRFALAAAPAAGLVAADMPNSLFGGVQIGVITYSYRSMPDQSAEAYLKYIVDSGVSAIELMGDPAETFAGRPAQPRRGGRGQELTAEQRAEMQAAQKAVKDWRLSVSMDKFKALRKMYNDAGVSIYAVKIMNPNMSDPELEYVFNVAEALGCTHTTLELPTDEAQLKRLGDVAARRKIYVAYHTHAQGSMTAFDRAFELSPGNMANVDLGHYVAGGNVGGTTLEFLEKHHARISSFHLKDRQTPEHGAGNLPWGTGDTPIKEILQLVKKRGWKMPGSVELEYQVPEGSNPVAEVRKCVEYCKAALA